MQRKVAISLVLLFSTFAVVSYSILVLVIAPAFDDLENAAARADLHRADAALQADIDRLHTVASDWSHWDDIHGYVIGNNPGFEKSNLDISTLETLGLDVMRLYDADSRLIWAGFQLHGGSKETVAPEVFTESHNLFAVLTSHVRPDSEAVGIVRTSSGPMITASMPILRTDSSGPIAGVLVMGQILDSSHLARLRERTDVDMYWAEVDAEQDLTSDTILSAGRDVISGAKLLPGINGEPVLNIRTQTPREISALGSQTIQVATFLLVLTGVLVCGFIWFTLRQTILQPIQELATHIDIIRDSGDLNHQLEMSRDDEIGSLADQFDELTQEVNDARQLLLDQSFKAGKADTAAEVMHNVRNAMTPMINGVDRIRQLFRDSGNLKISKALQQIEEPDCPPDRKSKLLQYLNASFRRVQKIGDQIMTETDVVSAQAQQIEGILADQERYSNISPVVEVLDIDELVDEASNVIPQRENRSIRLIYNEQPGMRQVRAYRVGLLQVLGNLFLNAFESISRLGQSGGEISLSTTEELVDEVSMVRLTVADNGAGFDEFTGAKIFRRGFTSKQESELAGLGLHWCANAVAGMGGRLTAESSGEGNGAKFHVLLPAA